LFKILIETLRYFAKVFALLCEKYKNQMFHAKIRKEKTQSFAKKMYCQVLISI